ncbi:unnamed protein product [Paramecium sonneborni]|uniref:RNA polymerase subunit H/Rpb5 C-terminal domain-containing protein n=1 Tax=Paramecium sonneborni TaxID=65129 RepID=A0A8S1PNA9_9CILI|nr:unnamed protein product [Paramecium sonneborni]
MVFPTYTSATKIQVENKKARLFKDQINSIQSYSFEKMIQFMMLQNMNQQLNIQYQMKKKKKQYQSLVIIKTIYGLVDNQLPRILKSVPIVKFLRLSNGVVVKIVRKSETAGLYVTYRIAV